MPFHPDSDDLVQGQQLLPLETPGRERKKMRCPSEYCIEGTVVEWGDRKVCPVCGGLGEIDKNDPDNKEEEDEE